MIADHSCLIFWNDLLVIVKHVNVTSQADDVWNAIKERCYQSPHSCQGAVMLILNRNLYFILRTLHLLT